MAQAAPPPATWTPTCDQAIFRLAGIGVVQMIPTPGRVARFEKIDGHNRDALKRPPVILMGDIKYFPNTDQAGYLCLPEKQSDGTLVLPDPVAYTPSGISCARHSGDGNIAVSAGDTIYIPA